MHEARLHDGTRVALKVMHRGMRERILGDLRNLTFLAELLAAKEPDYDFRKVAYEVRARWRHMWWHMVTHGGTHTHGPTHTHTRTHTGSHSHTHSFSPSLSLSLPLSPRLQWTPAVREELDLRNEALNLLSVGNNLRERKIEVIVPRPYRDLSTGKVLVMEFCEGFPVKGETYLSLTHTLTPSLQRTHTLSLTHTRSLVQSDRAAPPRL